ncbi:Arabinogalactan endo-beta-1 4-galactanase [Bienertia sinuspersici]
MVTMVVVVVTMLEITVEVVVVVLLLRAEVVVIQGYNGGGWWRPGVLVMREKGMRTHIPICTSIWSCPSETVMELSAYSVLSFCRDHHLLQLSGGPQWLAVKRSSQQFVNKIREEMEARGCQIRTSSEVHYVSKSDEGCTLSCADGSEDLYDECIIAVPAPETMKILGKEATHDEMRILGAFQYVSSDLYIHQDKKFMPRNQAAWSALNFQGKTNNTMCLTYWLNVLQVLLILSVIRNCDL